ncbi:YhbY family RNA-binding protein [Candidatus Pacearchaeota archaeon]|nr:YhbY family RNA-binding protein [Candidatus Pacearchaeota archaeon]
MEKIGHMQLGKQGITENFIGTLKHHFDKNKNVRVSVLKSAGHDKSKVKKYSEEILEKLGKNYTAKVVGFTIFFKKWRKARK